MEISPQQAKKVLTEKYVFNQLGFSMLLTRLKGVYANDPSQSTLQKCTEEINAFLLKFQPIMENDFTVLSNIR